MKTACRAVLALCFLVARSSLGFGNASAAEEPKIAIEGIKSLYCTGDMLEVTVQNHSETAISINVAMETYQNGKWIETWASLRTPPPQIPPKIAKTDLVGPQESIAYSFDILGFPLRPELVGARHRLRADGIANMQRTSITSAEFSVCSVK